MGWFDAVNALESRLGREGARELVVAVEAWLLQERQEMISRMDEKLTARQETIQRRIHEDIAGVEIRLTKAVSDLEVRVERRLSEFEFRLGEHKTTMLRWFVAVVVLQTGFLTLVSWATKALF